ncbi:hypothetical protein ACFX2G_032362 [Malus domestica]
MAENKRKWTELGEDCARIKEVRRTSENGGLGAGERGCPLGSSQRRRKERRSAGTQGNVTRGEAAIWQRELKRRTDSSRQVEG